MFQWRIRRNTIKYYEFHLPGAKSPTHQTSKLHSLSIGWARTHHRPCPVPPDVNIHAKSELTEQLA